MLSDGNRSEKQNSLETEHGAGVDNSAFRPHGEDRLPAGKHCGLMRYRYWHIVTFYFYFC